jgi:4-amino-4-deoxy-L-arabinose transferase-like glycosyltransferase
MEEPLSTPRSPSAPSGFFRRDLLLLILGVVLLYGPHLGRRALWSPDEGRYAEIPREMVATGDWVTPRLNGVKYFEKPPLFYWIEAASLRLFGPEEWALRLAPALFALLGILAVYVAGRRLYGRRAGLWAGVVLATTPLWFGLGEAVTLDMAVSALLTVTLLAFLFASRAEDPRERRLWIWVFYAAAALATLTKGLIGIVIPGMVLGAWMLATRDWRDWRDWRLIRLALSPAGIALFLAIAVPWHLLVSRANPEFAWFYFVHEHFLRYTTKVHKRYEPIWFFVPILLAGMLPWTVYLPRAIQNAWRRNAANTADTEERRATLLLLLWAGLVFAFFSFSDSKLVPYILPVLPPLALLLGRELAAAWEAREGAGRRGLAYLSLLLFAGILGTAFLVLPRIPKAAEFATLLGGYAYALAGSLFLMALLPLLFDRAGRGGRGGRPRAALVAAGVTAALFLTTLAASLPPLDPDRSVKALARTLRPRLQPGDEVASYHDYFQDLPFYLGRTVTVAAWRGELEYGMAHEDVSRWMIGEDELWRRWNGPGRVYLVVDRRSTPAALATAQVVARSGNNRLLVNHP